MGVNATNPKSWMPLGKHYALFIIGGLVITPITAFLAMASAGAGHGEYVLARLFFPYSMILTLLTGDRITAPLMAMALMQFPIYGSVLGLAVRAGGRKFFLTTMGIGFCHVIATIVAFSGGLPNFS